MRQRYTESRSFGRGRGVVRRKFSRAKKKYTYFMHGRWRGGKGGGGYISGEFERRVLLIDTASGDTRPVRRAARAASIFK